MLVMFLVTSCLSALAVCAIARTTHGLMERLGLDLTTTLLWFGLAEWPSEAEAPREPEVKQAVVEGPTRRRRPSPHRRLAAGLGGAAERTRRLRHRVN